MPHVELALYWELARFTADYLTHMHDEEARVMSRIWECCTDEEIAATRERFMATIGPQGQATTLEYVLPAIEDRTAQ